MLEISGYQILTQIYTSPNSIVYRGIQQQDKQPVILKMLKQDYPTPVELTHYKQEYEITRNLNVEGVVKAYSLQKYQNTPVIILEDFGGSSLKMLTNSTGEQEVIHLPEFLEIAIKISESLGQIHICNIIHKDINPSNIVLNPKTGQLKIIDFGIATILKRENPTLKNPNVLEGTLAYLSPEQTGRMNRTLDYRTDFYSLGVTFYELLTGQLPFHTADPLELVHCHIAKQPMPPHEVVPEIPKAVSDIVMKLMAKTAEERYQSAWGLKADLQECLIQLQTSGNISDFSLGSQDISDKFQIPQKLYGREAEVETLLAAFERVADNSQSKTEMILVAGYSGVGKSSLVAEIHKPNTRLRGYFTCGKFDQFQRNVPYSAIVNAFKGLVRQLLSESQANLRQWRDKLLAAFGANGQVIIDVIAEVELIVGKQPPVPELGPSESQTRFNLVFGKFIRTFCTKEHPLVIFLDDLQWADSATLKLIELMMMDTDMQYLFVIGAYRDNEVSPTHPLMITLDGLRNLGATITSITLAPLELEHISQLIADTLDSDTDKGQPLANLVMSKTAGNPFFVNQFLKSLHAENLITFDFEHYGWLWDIAQIEAQGITDNVVELMIGKLKKLPESTQQVLRLASCIGASFDLNTLSITWEKSKELIFPDLVTAIQFGLILPTSELDTNLLIQNYKFLHDRVQQAAYALIDDDRKKAVHLQIGRLLLVNISASRAEKIFEIVDHLNLAWELITDESELVELARLNLEAGQKAKASTAYAAALAQYFIPGIDVLPGDIWQEHYDLTFSLYRERSECEYLCGNLDKAEELFELILNYARSNLDRAEIQNIRVVLYDSRGKYLEAIRIAAEALKDLGLNLPTNNKSEILSLFELELQVCRANLKKIKIAELINLPEMTNPEIKSQMELLVSILVPGYYSNPDLCFLTTLKMVNLSIEYGNSEESAYGYALWGITLGSRLVDYEMGYKFGQVAMKLNAHLNNGNLTCKIFNAVGGLIMIWRSHLKNSIPILRDGYLAGVKTGDVNAGTNSYNLILIRIMVADNLSSILKESKKHLDFLKQAKKPIYAGVQQMYQRFIFNLQGLTSDKFSLSDREFDEFQCLQMWQENSFMTGVAPYNIFKAQIFFLYGDYQAGLKQARASRETVFFVTNLAIEPEHYFYYSLILTALYPTASDSEQQEYWETLTNHQQKMKIWADNCPENSLHKYLLVEAEIARISGKGIEATLDLYDRAIASARENGYIQNEALANELAAKFWLEKGKQEFAQLYMKKAHYGYQLWGAKRKVKDLEEKYPQLLPQSSAVSSIASTQMTTTSPSTMSESGAALDLATVIKASQAISGEIVLEQLLRNLMKILIENAGAQIGYLILKFQEQWLIEAEGAVDSDKVTVLQSIPIDNHLPNSIINYVAHTCESVVLNDAMHEDNFTNDPYIKTRQPKSILCFPLINQGKIVSIIYLENNLTTNTFTPDRLEVLKLLSTQAAISIENARLYQTLEYKVKERTAQLAQANQEITTLNEKLKAENLRMSAELEVTRQLQQMILPKKQELSQIPGLEIAGFMEPADEVGGDYYDVLQHNGRVKIGIGDITGHGLESGVLMIMVQTAVKTLLEHQETDFTKFLSTLNRVIYDNARRMNSRKTLTLALLDYHAGCVSISGQHEEIIVVRADGQIERIDTDELGFPLGLVTEIDEFIQQTQVQLEVGDGMVLYTDGIIEAKNSHRQEYGLKRLCHVLSQHWQQTADEIRQLVIADVQQHIGDSKICDDMTLLVLKQK